MALGRQGERQSDLLVTWREMPRASGHAFYDRLQGVLIEASFDGHAAYDDANATMLRVRLLDDALSHA